ncbi:MAG: bacterial Ig-like domain-containing protein [Propionibacterium acidifaciens]
MDSTGRPTARIGVAVVAMLVCLIGLGSPRASAAQSDAIYTGTSTDTAPLVDGGLTHSAYFTVTDRSGGSGQSNHSATGAGAHSIVDLDDYAGLTATITVSNTTGAALELDETATLPTGGTGPGAPRLVASGAPEQTDGSATAHQDGGAGATPGSDGTSPAPQPSDGTSTAPRHAAGVTLAYGTTGGEKSTEPPADGWSSLRSLLLTGSLAPGETFTVSVALTLVNADGLDPDAKAWVGIDEELRSPAAASSATNIRFARRVAGAGAGRYRASANAPESIQALMPEMTAGDLTVSNLDGTDAHVAGPDDALFTGGTVSLNLARVRSAIRDAGWQVETDDDAPDGLAATHEFPSGVLSSPAAAGAGALGGAEVPIRQVISAVGSTVPVGSAWSPADNLEWIHDHAGADVGIDSADVRVVSDVDTSTPGLYRVTYYYAPQSAHYAADDYEAAATVQVAVTGGRATITGTTTLQGADLQAGQFTFQATSASGERLGTATNLADGSFALELPAFDRSSIDRTLDCTVTEVVPDGAVQTPDGAVVADGIAYDTHTEHVQVRVSAGGDGADPVATVVTDADGVTFSNVSGAGGAGTPSPTAGASTPPTPGASAGPIAEPPNGNGSDGDGSIKLISDESAMLAMGTGAVMVAVGTVIGLHGNRPDPLH